jgi:hypothetical protein
MSRCDDRISDYFDACSDLDLAPPKFVSLCSPHSKNDSACAALILMLILACVNH